ncbi:hypothetical protein J4E91_007199 [Alternaria rosae]|nr:hypothetical protein J4E91_007199 [Alternaria rosae]
MEEDELPDLEIGDYSAEYNWRTSKRNVGQESPTPIARDILQGDNIHDFERTTQDEQVPDLTKEDPLEDDEIRILVLYPSDDYNAPLQGRRERQRLMPNESLSTNHDDATYEAVSYTWGTDVYEGFISIDGVNLPIPLNLELALRRIRHDRYERRIWADAVCINIGNLVERGYQLFNIRRIFQSAKTVFVWLGEESENSPAVLPFMNRIARTADMDNPVFGDVYDMEWQALQAFLVHPYFTRIWVVQEIAVARHIDVLRGGRSLYWKTFLKAIRASRRRFAQRNTKLSPYVASRVERAISFVLNIDECFRLNKGEHTGLPALSLEELVFKFSTAEASDQRDNIYGLLEIAADADLWKSNKGFPDYSRSWEDVQKTFYMSCIQYSRSLDVIFRPWAWPHSSPWLYQQADDRDCTVSLVPAPGQTSLNNLFDVRDLDPALRELTVLNSDCILTRGYLFDEVESITDVHENSDIPCPASWLSEDFLTDALKFARTLLTDARRVDIDLGLLVRYLDRLADEPEDSESHYTRLSVYFRAVKDFLLLKDQLPIIEFTVPFEVATSDPREVSTVAHIVDNDPTKEVLDLVQDSQTHLSKDSTNTSMVRVVNVPQTAQGFRMYWTCTCGFKGLGHYMEYRPGAIKELAIELQNGGYTVTLEPWNPVDIWNNCFDTAVPRLQMIAENFWKQHVIATLYPTSREVPNMKAADSISDTDRELFTKLREAYAANFSWAHRNLSIWTVQKINFVKFNQWERNEVANLQHGVPPDSERHYTSKPNPRGYEPVLDNDFLMHRFTCSQRARCLDASIGFEHIPKRIGRPEPWDHNEHPDLGIGWGLQLEEGCFRRLCIIVVGGFVVSAVTGIIWSALARDVQSGFAVASWLLASGTILVATIQLLVTLPAI